MIGLQELADGSLSDQNFQKLRSLVIDTGGQSVGMRFGTNAATWTAAAKSAAKSLPHGLGRVPVNAQLTGYNDVVFEIVSYDATNLVVVGLSPGGSISGTFSFDWLVIG